MLRTGAVLTLLALLLLVLVSACFKKAESDKVVSPVARTQDAASAPATEESSNPTDKPTPENTSEELPEVTTIEMSSIEEVATVGPLGERIYSEPDSEPDQWEIAANKIVRLPPDAFPELPEEIRAELKRRGGTIPQSFLSSEDMPDAAKQAAPRNVIKGHFRKAGQTDWAVLCSVNGSSSILIFWNGRMCEVTEMLPGEDRQWLQTIDSAGTPGFSRGIFTAGAKRIASYYKAFGGPEPPPISHDGIEVAFLEKASTVYYWHEGKFLELQGMD